MEPPLIPGFVRQLISENNWKKVRQDFLDITVDAKDEEIREETNSALILIGDAPMFRIESQAGDYDLTENDENEHTHWGIVKITNRSDVKETIKFLRIIENKPEKPKENE